MRVLHIIDSLAGGGKERQLVELLKGLSSEPDIVCHAAVMSNVIEYEDFFRLEAGTTILPRRSRYDISMFSRVHAVMRSFRPDIVQSWNTMCSVYAVPLAKLVGAKFVDGFVRTVAASRTLRDPDFFRSRFTLPFTDLVIGNSRAGLSSYSIPKAKTMCIYNGFDRARVARLADTETIRRSLKIETEHVVGMVATFSRFKDYDTFFEAARHLCAERDVTCVAVGAGPRFEEYRARLAQHPRIRLLGRRDDVESIVNIFSVGVLTSNTDTHGEGISNAIMEYMALGKPVIATDCGGNGELVVEGRTGYLIGSGDVAALTERAQRLLDDPALARRLGKEGRERIHNEFSLERMTSDYVRLYRELAAQR